MNNDIRDHEPKLFGIATSRQFICLGIGFCYSIPISSLFHLDVANRIMAIAFLMLPVIGAGWLKIYGLNFEIFIWQTFKSVVMTPNKRIYVRNDCNYLKEEKTKEKKKIIPSDEYPPMK